MAENVRMVTTWGAWGWGGALVLALGACGGDPFVLGDASADASMDEAHPDASADAPPASTLIRCPTSMPCSLAALPPNGPQTCCTSTTSANSSSCTGGACSCMAQLECASDANCPGAQACCIATQVDVNCAAGHPVAHCVRGGCLTGARLCDPNGEPCPASRGCSANAADLAAVGLPANVGYGVCK